MRKAYLCVSLFIISAYCFAGDTIVDLNGKKIVVHDNFTWEFQKITSGEATTPINLVKDRNMDKQLKSKTGKFIVSYDSSNWEQTKSSNDSAEFMLQNKESSAYGLLIFEGLSFPLSAMADFIIKNANNIDPNAKLVNTENCTVNGTDGELLTYTAANSGVEFTFYTFVASKDSGTVQFTFYTLSNTFEKLKPSFLAAMSGIEF